MPPAIFQASRWTIKASKNITPTKMSLKGKPRKEEKIWEEGPSIASSAHSSEINKIPATMRKMIRLAMLTPILQGVKGVY
jgi:hypothetical protein